MRLFLMTSIGFILAGCFWVSDPPDLHKNDKPTLLVVIWNQVVSDNTIKRSAWHTRNKSRLMELIQHLETHSWKSLSVLPTCHSTRIILTMESGDIWEICQSTGKTKMFKMFKRNNNGWSGKINWSDNFLQKLTSMIESESSYSIDLTKDHRTAISSGALHKIVPDTTQDFLNEYPGYPEMIWNQNSKKFEYSTK